LLGNGDKNSDGFKFDLEILGGEKKTKSLVGLSVDLLSSDSLN